MIGRLQTAELELGKISPQSVAHGLPQPPLGSGGVREGEGLVLVVLDDVTDLGSCREVLPTANRFRVLMTTRLRSLDTNFVEIRLDVLSPEAALELLTALVGERRVGLTSPPAPLLLLRGEQEQFSFSPLPSQGRGAGGVRSFRCPPTLYDVQGHYSKAELLYVQALALRERLLGEDDLGVALSLNNLAAFYNYQERYSEAEPLLVKALTLVNLSFLPLPSVPEERTAVRLNFAWLSAALWH